MPDPKAVDSGSKPTSLLDVLVLGSRSIANGLLSIVRILYI